MAARVVLPLIAQGPIIRRPRAESAAARVDAMRRSSTLLSRLRDKYGDDPLLVSVGGRQVVLPLAARDVREILALTPDPYSPASREKSAALRHFEPDAVLITPPGQRPPRRALNEAVLDTPHSAHHLAGAFHSAVRDETGRLLQRVGPTGIVTWERFHLMFHRIVRRIVLGSGAADDVVLTRLLDSLRADGNWAFAHPRRSGERGLFADRLAGHLRRAEAGSLAGSLADLDGGPEAEPYAQVPHWLFAFDAAAIAAFDTLALLAAHESETERACREVEAYDPDDPRVPAELAFLRSCVLEALRLWPTTLVILREPLRPTPLAPVGAAVAIVSSFFHRDAQALDFADRFTPEAWPDGRAAPARGIVPFSDGAAACPGRNLVLYTVTAVLAEVLRDFRGMRLLSPMLVGGPLPHTLDHTQIEIAFGPAK
ncbi:cytochrome P450 [Yinghuangia soli]|uniref:Cytochrome P450 n=1 Tax=Yinghuangia soli TaxID=2908204 RepID=A0AA41Q8M7_9ACTN|nr:cytochrome P450 [Yinghuangia soli]MCF2533257.1 cytochrome P450 [Yinghuangia soli]